MQRKFVRNRSYNYSKYQKFALTPIKSVFGSTRSNYTNYVGEQPWVGLKRDLMFKGKCLYRFTNHAVDALTHTTPDQCKASELGYMCSLRSTKMCLSLRDNHLSDCCDLCLQCRLKDFTHRYKPTLGTRSPWEDSIVRPV